MNAIVPLNIAAVRVSTTDSSNVVPHFKGRVANFDNIPYGRSRKGASTGDTIVQPLASEKDNEKTALAPLDPGIHLHWELPDYFLKGVQSAGSREVVFPQAPNRWLVIRYLNLYDADAAVWGPATTHSWVVESDYIMTERIKDTDGVLRPSIPVPLPVNPANGKQPFRYMGRILDAADWPKSAPGDEYLRDYPDKNGNPHYLTAMGFVGPGFATYYPECCTVFGFHDRFLDQPKIADALRDSKAIRFKASYQVIGWIDGPDPLDGVEKEVRDQYQSYVDQCLEKRVPVSKQPIEFFDGIMQQKFKWRFNKEDIKYKLNGDQLETMALPAKTICSGIMEEIIWDMLKKPGASGFLGDPTTPTEPGVWIDKDTKIGVGNTSVEALSALLKYDNPSDSDSDWKDNYELVLNALQLGMLNEIENKPNSIIDIEETLHANGFAGEDGGLLWIVQDKPTDITKAAKQQHQPSEVTLPLPLAKQLSRLNQAQKEYDTGRKALSILRKQLFMDWYRYLQLHAGGATGNVSSNDLVFFIRNGEHKYVVDAGLQTGLLTYRFDPENSGAISGIDRYQGATDCLAAKVQNELEQFQQAMLQYPQWYMVAGPAPSFWMPTDPVAVIEGKRMEGVRRNGMANEIMIRFSSQLLNRLLVDYQGASFTLDVSQLTQLSGLAGSLPFQEDFRALTGEALLLMPSLAPIVANALQVQMTKQGVAAARQTELVEALREAQGGSSSALGDGTPFTGLFQTVRQANYSPKANPQQAVSQPVTMEITFTNAAANGWVPDAVAWNTQLQYKAFSEQRYDPFLPIYLTWVFKLDPIKKGKDPLNYTVSNLTDFFEMDEYAIDYQYDIENLPLTTGNDVKYAGSAILSKKATFSLTAQIDNFIANYPGDPNDPENPNTILSEISESYKGRKITTQTMSGFNVGQLLRNYIPQIPVANLTTGARDTLTNSIKTAATTANAGDNWYNDQFNAESPMSVGSKALSNFGPLRGGFAAVDQLEVIDVFGQRMKISTPGRNKDGSLQVMPSMTMSPTPDDVVNGYKIYLPPRILTPTRLWFRWLSAAHHRARQQDFVEMNTHPATSPVCGWIMPNHLSDNLFFYDADGQPIGSFGIEHGRLKYRTRAGNISNPTDSLEQDIGKIGSPIVNSHLADFIWYICRKSGDDACKEGNQQSGTDNSGFLDTLMQAILDSDQYINPANYAQDPSLAVLIGRPLAITRAVLNIETAGRLLPINPSDSQTSDPWTMDIKADHNARRFEYPKRMETGTANLDQVLFPLRLGDTTNVDDGLIGYIVEQEGAEPYGDSPFYAPAAPANQHGISAPSAHNIQLSLNAAPITLTLLMDPRAPIHATTGVLPVETLGIPSDQFIEIMKNMQVTFFTMPVLEKKQELIVPLPAQRGYVWSWVNPGDQTPVKLVENAANHIAAWDYSPQTLLEGWLKLSPEPDIPSAEDGE